MTSGLPEKLCRINARMGELLELARKALNGGQSFGVAEVRMIREPLTEMEPILAQSTELRERQPEVAAQLDLYKAQLLELQNTIEKLRVTLIVHKASLEASGAQVMATSQWCAAFRQTR